MSDLEGLYATLDARPRPEDVAQMILEVSGEDLSPDELRVLEGAAGGALKRFVQSFSSMADDFFRPVGCAVQVETARTLFKDPPALAPERCGDPEAVGAFLAAVGREIHKPRDKNDYQDHRLNRADRKAQGLDHSRRRYNKLFRMLRRLEKKLARYRNELEKMRLFRVAKAGLASEVPREDFFACPRSAAFVAYLTARSNLRSEFTIAGQQQAFDEVAAMLLRRCEASPQASWLAIAHVYPDRAVLARLDAEDQAQLFGRWLDILYTCADKLRTIWNASEFDRETMIVRRGNDSTTWNLLAGAWNQARTHWVAMLDVMGNGDVLDRLCPGKVLRLMAADVAAWHESSGGGLSADTLVWNELPLPWEVLRGEVACTKAEVEAACAKHSVHPVKKGWVAPRPTSPPAPFRSTPELVHGVAVSSPHLAAALKKAGWFSGKAGEWRAAPGAAGAVVRRDPQGFVTGVDEGE